MHFRYALLANRPESADSDFSWHDMRLKVNGELLSNFGNFVNRYFVFFIDDNSKKRAVNFVCSKDFYGTRVPPKGELSAEDLSLIEAVNSHLATYIDLLENVCLLLFCRGKPLTIGEITRWIERSSFHFARWKQVFARQSAVEAFQRRSPSLFYCYSYVSKPGLLTCIDHVHAPFLFCFADTDQRTVSPNYCSRHIRAT